MQMEDQQLETELQELYLTGKQWLSDCDFVECEQLFLMALVTDMPGDRQLAFRSQIDNIGNINEQLRSRILAFMKLLESLIIKKNIKLDRSLIDDFANLQESVAHAMERLKLLKSRVLALQPAA